MSTERIAHRRLYRALGCSLAGGVEFSQDFDVGSNVSCHVYLGACPRFGLWEVSGGRYIVPEAAPAVLWQMQFTKDLRVAERPPEFFCEVAAYRDIEIPDETSAAYRAGDVTARERVLAQGAAARDELVPVLDLVAGIVGLRFHRQFVLELVNENHVVLLEGDFVGGYSSPGAELLQGIELNARGLEALRSLLAGLGRLSEQTVSAVGAMLHWLLRAWPERDAVNRFLSLFVPMEGALQGVSIPMSAVDRGRARRVRRALRAAGGDSAAELVEFFNRLIERRRPSLEERFAKFAEYAGVPGWSEDVAAFAHFNRMRNQLLHRGERTVSLRVTIMEDHVRDLEDLVERYVGFVLFRDHVVYPSRWRPPGSGLGGE